MTQDFWNANERPTQLQRIWADLFIAVWNVVEKTGAGAGSGKTWFWQRVVRHIDRSDPFVLDPGRK